MTLPTRRLVLQALALGAAGQACAAAAQAVKVEGQSFERRVRLGGSELLLNGTGVRAVAWFKGFAAGLYLVARSASAAQVLAAPGPKRLQIRMLQDVPAAEFVKAFRKGIERNATPEERTLLGARMQVFEDQVSALGRVRRGDVIDLDFDPTRGLVLNVNGTLRGEAVAGADFYAALLRAFVGEHPYDDRLKAGLLGMS